jgi:hypothetical protein
MKCVKVPGRKVAPMKTSAVLKIVVVQATHSKAMSEAKVVPRASALSKTVASSVASVSKVAATVSSSGAGVLKITTWAKRPVEAPSPVVKGK